MFDGTNHITSMKMLQVCFWACRPPERVTHAAHVAPGIWRILICFWTYTHFRLCLNTEIPGLWTGLERERGNMKSTSTTHTHTNTHTHTHTHTHRHTHTQTHTHKHINKNFHTHPSIQAFIVSCDRQTDRQTHTHTHTHTHTQWQPRVYNSQPSAGSKN